MKPVANFALIGMKELQAKLKDAGPRLQKKVLGPALRSGAQVIVNDAQRRVPVRSGGLKKSLGLVVRRKRRALDSYAAIGARRGHATVYKGRKYDPANIAHLVEGGHGAAGATRTHEGRGRKRRLRVFKGTGGAAEPHKFLEPAFNAKKAEALNKIAEKIDAGMKKELGGRS